MLGSASITINVNGKWNGGLDGAVNDLMKLGKAATGSAKDASAALKRSEDSARRMSVAIASTSASTSKSLMDASSSVVRFSGELWAASDRAGRAGAALTKGVTVPLTAVGAYASQAAVKYDTAMADLRKTTDMTQAELEQFGEAAKELSTVQPVSADAILSIEALGAQLGVQKQNLESFALTVSGLDIATDMNAEQAATEMQRFANITGMAESDFGRFGSTLVKIGNTMATTESEVSRMSLRLASAGKQAGMSEAEVLGLAGAMSSLGIKAEMGGSAMSQIMVKISKAASEGGAALDAFASAAGMSADQFAQSWSQSPMDALTSLLSGIKESTDAGAAMNVVLGELGITEIRQSDVMRRLAGSADLVAKSVGTATAAWEDNTALTAEVESRNESMAARLQVLKNRLDEIAITVGVPLVNGAIAALDALDPLIQGVADAAQSFADMDEAGQRNVLMLAALATGAGPVLSTVGALGRGVSGIVNAFGQAGYSVGVFSDAMRTSDGAQIKAYSSLNDLNAQLGLSKNKVVEAAGGVTNYVSKWEEWYNAEKQTESLSVKLNETIAKRASVMTRAAAETGKSKESLIEQATALLYNEAALTKQVKAQRKAAASARETLDGWTDMAGAARVSTKAAAEQTTALDRMGDAAKLGGSKLAAMGASFLKFAGVTAIVGLVGAAIGEVARQLGEAERKQRLLNESQMTFGEVAAEAEGSARAEALGFGSLTDAIGETMQGLADLNRQSGETMAELAVNSKTADQYVSVIESLRDKSNLTAVEQEKLKLAVRGYNEVTGSTLGIVDLVNGRLSMSSDELAKNTENWKKNAEAQALQQLAVEYTKKQVKAQLELEAAQDGVSKATAEVEKAEAAYNEARKDGVVSSMDEGRALTDAQAKLADQQAVLKDAQSNYDSASESIDQLTQRMAANSEECQKLKDALAGINGATEGLEQAGVNLDAFSLALSNAGVSADQLTAIGPEITNLAATFGYDIDQMVWAIQNYNTVPIENKDGSINVNDASLIDAQGNVWTWNGTTFVSKTANASVNDVQLRDAQGRLYKWNGSQLVPQSTTAKADVQEVDSGTKSKEKYNKTKPENQSASAKVSHQSVKDAAKAIKSYNDNPPKSFSAQSYVDNYITNHVRTVKEHAAGGIANAGRMAFHARGGIATRETDVTRHIAGEAGAEALVPLTSRRYAMPFVRMVAGETARIMGGAVSRGGGDTYVLNIDGMHADPSPRAMDALRVIFDEYAMTAGMGAA